MRDNLTTYQKILYYSHVPSKRYRKQSDFNPDTKYINDATEEFLKNGGKIKKIETEIDTMC